MEQGFSTTFGQDMTEEVLYRLFNPDGEASEERVRNIGLDELIQSYMKKGLDEETDGDEEGFMREWSQSTDPNWMRNYMREKRAKQAAWKELLDRIRSGEVQPSDLSSDQLLHSFLDQVMDGLSEEGLLTKTADPEKFNLQKGVMIVHPEFSEKSEEVIAKKVLEEVFIHLEKQTIGPHELDETGMGNIPSGKLQEYDELQHRYDMLDIQESLINTAMRNPVNLKIESEDLRARLPLHETKSSNVLLIDSSYSMRGDKFKGAVLAALGLRELLKREYKEDRLYVVAYNQKPQLLNQGDVIRLKPYGYTDIGQALDFSTELLSKEEGNRNIFLLTDGEPTSTYQKNQTPEESTLRAAYLAGKSDVMLNIVMLDRRPELKRICEKMARLNGDSVITYVENPLNLKEFVIKSFMDYRKIRHYAVA